MSQSKLFKTLGVTLANVRWSWGAVRPADGAVFLRVWHDRVQSRDGAIFVRVSHQREENDDLDELGNAERQAHIDLIRNGATSYLVICRAVDPKATPRKVASFNDKEVFPGGRLIDSEGETYLQVMPRIPWQEAMAKPVPST